MVDKSSMVFSFCGDYEVNAQAVSTAIKSLVDLSSAVAKTEYPEVEFRLTVKAVKPGSLQFEFVAAAALAVQSILTPNNVAYAASLIEVMSAAFKIKRFLQGKAPKSKETVEDRIIITHQDGSTLSVPKSAGVYFIDNRVDKSIVNIIESAKLSDGVSGISVTSTDRIEIPRDEFDKCSEEIPLEEESKEIVTVRQNDILFIRQADLSGELKWRFKGTENITAAMTDKHFLNKIRSGEQKISATMYLIADVRVTIRLGPDGIPDETKCTHEVIKVHSIHDPNDGQIKISE